MHEAGGFSVRLETARLVMDLHTVADFDALAEMWADEPVIRHITGRPATRQESWMRLLRYRGLWALLGYGYWALRCRQSGRFVGDVGFADFLRVLQPSIAGIPEAGWVLAAWAHGRGFASEAVGAALGWLDGQAFGGRSVCLIDPDNAPSLRIAATCGYGGAEEVEFQGNRTLLLTRVRHGHLPEAERAGIVGGPPAGAP